MFNVTGLGTSGFGEFGNFLNLGKHGFQCKIRVWQRENIPIALRSAGGLWSIPDEDGNHQCCLDLDMGTYFKS